MGFIRKPIIETIIPTPIIPIGIMRKSGKISVIPVANTNRPTMKTSVRIQVIIDSDIKSFPATASSSMIMGGGITDVRVMHHSTTGEVIKGCTLA